MVLAALRMAMMAARFMTGSFQFRVARKPINAQTEPPEGDSQICAAAAPSEFQSPVFEKTALTLVEMNVRPF